MSAPYDDTLWAHVIDVVERGVTRSGLPPRYAECASGARQVS